MTAAQTHALYREATTIAAELFWRSEQFVDTDGPARSWRALSIEERERLITIAADALRAAAHL